MARRIVRGESVTAIQHEQKIRRSVLYRWRNAYLKAGEAGLQGPVGRPGQAARSAQEAAEPSAPKPGEEAAALEKARARNAELERIVGKQALEIDFLTGAFKRVKESSQNKSASGKTASTERSEA